MKKFRSYKKLSNIQVQVVLKKPNVFALTEILPAFFIVPKLFWANIKNPTKYPNKKLVGSGLLPESKD